MQFFSIFHLSELPAVWSASLLIQGSFLRMLKNWKVLKFDVAIFQTRKSREYLRRCWNVVKKS